MDGVSVVVNVIESEIVLLPRLFKSLGSFPSEIVVVSMAGETPELSEICEKFNATLCVHKPESYVEAARNYGVGRARGEWIFVLDPDEEVPRTLIERLKKAISKSSADYFRIPRKNMIFGKWMEHSRFWPDYNIRFFKKNAVSWTEEIHSIPVTQGKGQDIPEKEEYAIIHHHYQSIGQFLVRMDRYTSVQAAERAKKNTVGPGGTRPYKFIWKDLLTKPTGEFLSRYFAGEGYKDGLHGLAISLLQTFSEVVVYLKIWEGEKFLQQAVSAEEVSSEFGKMEGELNWWISDMVIKNKNFLASLPRRVQRKLMAKKNG